MKNAAQISRLAGFDMGILVSLILRNGIFLSMGLITAGLILSRFGNGPIAVGYPVRAESVLELFLKGLQSAHPSEQRAVQFLHLGIGVLLITPYLRVVASAVYFGCVERRLRQALLSGGVLAVLTVILLTPLV